MIPSENQTKQLKTAIERALNKVYDKDHYLIENKVHERTIVNRFLIYFQEELNSTDFINFNLDFEYNKDHSNPKRTETFKNGIYPDVILHQRDNNEKNILIIEFKTWWGRNTNKDIQKLKEFTDKNGKYKYCIGYSIVFDQEQVRITLVKNGEVCDEYIKRIERAK